MASPTERTLAYLRRLGFTIATVERWNPHARIRQDLFGFADLLAISKAQGIVAIQACSDTDHAKRRAKIEAEPRSALWRAAGGKVWLVSWKKRPYLTKRGAVGKAKRWAPRIETFGEPLVMNYEKSTFDDHVPAA